jgi:hypothetical protein
MIINSDINVLGSLPDWNLINIFLIENIGKLQAKGGLQSFTTLKTDKSVKRFEKAISATLITFQNKNVEDIFREAIISEKITKDTLLMLYWNASENNSLLNYLNERVFFPAFYSGRVTIKNDEVVACLNELKETEDDLKKWADSTIEVTASKFLTLLKKFGLMEGSQNKTINHPHLSDKAFLLFIYWLLALEPNNDILKSSRLNYAFSEKQILIERLLQKKYSKYLNVTFTGDKLRIETLIPYKEIYHVTAKF